MNDSINFVLAQHPFQKFLIANVTANDFYFLNHVGLKQFTLRYPVSHQTNDVRAKLIELAYQPCSDKPRRPGNESWAILPKLAVDHYAQTFQGGCPLFHRLSSRRTSRSVSIHCQKSGWR